MAASGIAGDPNEDPRIPEVLDRIPALVDPDDVPMATAFATAYLRRLSSEVPHDAAGLAAQTVGLLSFIKDRPDGPLIRAFNPVHDTHGYDTTGTVIELVAADIPFLHDSVMNEIQAHGLSVDRVLHPVIGVDRDGSGTLLAVRNARHTTSRESVQHYELDRRLFDADLPGVEAAIGRVVDAARRVVRDFHPMVGQIDRLVEILRVASPFMEPGEAEERIAFLHWLKEDNFIFLGYREYQVFETDEGTAVQVRPDSGLGLLSEEAESGFAEPRLLDDLPPDVRNRFISGDNLVITKTNRMSPVHRRAKMDYIGVRMLGADGETVGEARLLGLFTSKAYMEPASRLPILRRKLAAVMEAEDLIQGSHDQKAVTQFFDGFSKQDLFSSSVDDLRRALMGLLGLQERQRVRLFVRRDLYQRSVSVIVALPRDRFNPQLRRALQDLFVERFGGTAVEYHLQLGESDPAQIHFTVWVEGAIPEVSYQALEEEVVELARSWREQLAERLAERNGASAAADLIDRWGDRFPDYYVASTDLSVAAADVERLETLAAGDAPFVVGIQNEEPGRSAREAPLTRISLYRRGGKRPLTELMPALEDLGVAVIEEIPTRLEGPGEEFFIHDFGVLDRDGRPLDVDTVGDRARATLAAAWQGEVVSDSLHRLVVDAGLTHEQVAILRAYRTYWRRVMPVFTVAYVNETLVAHPDVTAALVGLFELRFGPETDDERYDDIRSAVVAALDAIPSLDEDRILRSFLRMIEATVRTNAFAVHGDALAFKFRSEDVPDMPRPHPMVEIFVIGNDVEGIHLRGGPIARGGIRWSTRREDYRTEVLGLMKAQMTKNAVIVPTGAKGGFVLRRQPSDPAELPAAVRAGYETFIRGLLDLTDDREGGEIVHPPGMRVHDGPDPYLVVAADKGTATFSDVANAIARERGFWMDDAFASGGSSGYDHKALGITARGAWCSLERHFLELGIDPSSDDFTAVGIGDMSGDVFGNGMLLSEHLALVAAFDHRHVFLDPNPDPARSYRERRRLFEHGGSSWEDYERSLLSEGGGVWSRAAKRIELSEAARRVLGTDLTEGTPDEVIRLILKAPVDLLWNGGIGTYVKASSESHDDVGDRVNDPVRIDAEDLRARVVVEGGNLGLTQRARIEFARLGGRINTDFIDNSGGVDCSDREVNLKILLGVAEREGLIDRAERDELVARAADAVVERILEDNFHQAQMLSQEELVSADKMEAYEELIVDLEREGVLDRTLDVLPSSEEMAERARSGVGLTRPELAVLLVDAKRALDAALLASDLPDQDSLIVDLETYFPPEIAERFGPLLREYPLRRELVSTILANDVVNSQGVTFIGRLSAQTGAAPPAVVQAYRIARDVSGARAHRAQVEALFGVVEQERWIDLMDEADRLVSALTRWYLSHEDDRPLSETVERYAGEVEREFTDALALGPAEWAEERRTAIAEMIDAGIPESVAARHALSAVLLHGPDVVDVAGAFERSPADVLATFLHVGRAVYLDRLEATAATLDIESPWQRWALQTVEDELVSVRRRLVERILEASPTLEPEEAVARYLLSHSRAVARLVRFMRSYEGAPGDDVAPLMVAVRQVRALAG